MALLTLTNAHLAFGHVALLDGADFALETSERVALIGRNGTGKSSMLKILVGLDKPDDDLLQVERGLRRSYWPQEPQFALDLQQSVVGLVQADEDLEHAGLAGAV